MGFSANYVLKLCVNKRLSAMDNCKIIVSDRGLIIRGSLIAKNKTWCLKVDIYELNLDSNSLNLLQNCVKSFNIAQTHCLSFVNQCSSFPKNHFIFAECRIKDCKVITFYMCRVSVRARDSENILNILPICMDKLVRVEFVSSHVSSDGQDTLSIMSDRGFYGIDCSGKLIQVSESKEIPKGSSLIWESSNVVWKDQVSAKSNIRFLLMKTNNKEVQELFGMMVQTNTSKTSVKLYDATLVIPRLYAAVTVAVCVNVRNNHSFQNCQWSSYFEKSIVVIATTKGQLVQFCDGKLNHVCNLPYLDVVKMSSMINSLGEEYLLVFCSSHQLHIFNEKFEVMMQLHDVEEYFVEDFLLCGSQQLISLQNVTSETITFYLNDLAVYCFTSADEKDDNKSSHGDTQSLDMVTRALTKRLQNSVNDLQKSESISRRREAVIQSTLQSVNDISHQVNSSSSIGKFTGLVPLVGVAESTAVHMVEGQRDTLTVSEMWQRTVQNKWVIGITVRNKDSRSMRNVSLSFIPEELLNLASADITTSTRSYLSHITPSEEAFQEPPHKKLHLLMCEEADTEPEVNVNKVLETIASGTTADVLVTTDVPLFDQATEKTYTVSLSWCYCSCKATVIVCDGHCSDLLHTSSHCVKTVGRIGLTVTEVVSRKHEVSISPQLGSGKGLYHRRNLLSLNTVQEGTDLKLNCTYSCLGNIRYILENQLSFRFQAQYNQYIVTESGPLNIVRVRLWSSSEKTARISVFTVDKAQLFLFFHTLYKMLPDDVTIETDLQPETDKLIREALSVIAQETSSTKSAMKKIVQLHEERLKTCFQPTSLVLSHKDRTDQLEGGPRKSDTARTPTNVFSSAELDDLMQEKLMLEAKTNSTVQRVVKLC